MDSPLTPESALALAIERVGSQGKLARLLGISQPSVWRWVQRQKQLPPEHVLAVEAATGVSRHHLRPDIYPLESSPPDLAGDDAPPAADLTAGGARVEREDRCA